MERKLRALQNDSVKDGNKHYRKQNYIFCSTLKVAFLIQGCKPSLKPTGSLTHRTRAHIVFFYPLSVIMKTLQCRQATVLLSYLGVFSLATANPLPENSYGSDLDYVSMFNGDDPASSGINWDDTSAWGSDQGDQTLFFDSTSTTDLSDLNPIDGSLIAHGSTLKAPYCGTTEQPVCCSQLVGYKGCRQCKALSHPSLSLPMQIS